MVGLEFDFPEFFFPNLATKPVDPGVAPKYTLRRERQSGLTDSWRQWAEAREVEEWIQSIAGVLEQGWNDQFVFYIYT